MRKKIVGIMGPGAGAKEIDVKNAFELGRLIAEEGWVLLSGGMKSGVMDAANQGAKEAGGLTVGVLPTSDNLAASDAVDIPIVTGMGSARNNINVLSSELIIACGMGPGTASEITLAIKAGKKVVLLNDSDESKLFFKKLSEEHVFLSESPEDALGIVKEILN